MTQRQRPAPPHDPAWDELRADASRGRARGRRSRPRHHLRLCRVAPQASVRVRQDAVAERRDLHRRTARRIRSSGRTTPARSRSRSARSAGVSRTYRRSSSREAASTASHPACAHCTGSPNWKPDEGRGRGRDAERTDRWKALDFSPPTHSGEPADPVLLEYEDDGRVAVITLNRPPRQRDHDRDGSAPDGGPRVDRRASRRSRRGDHRRRRARVLGRQRPAPAQEHDEGAVASPTAGFRPHALHVAPAAQADLRRRQRRRLRRRLRDRAEHRLHHRLRQRHVRAAGGDDRPRRRRRLAGLPPARPAARQGAADADDRRPDQRRRRRTGSAWSTRSIRSPS